jgi:hypothetical protein
MEVDWEDYNEQLELRNSQLHERITRLEKENEQMREALLAAKLDCEVCYFGELETPMVETDLYDWIMKGLEVYEDD